MNSITKLEQMRDKLKKCYESEDVSPESEEDLAAFEKENNLKIPEDYRWLLKEFGAFNFGEDPFINTLEELKRDYKYFIEIYKDYQKEENGFTKIPKDFSPFLLGGFGEGSLAFIDTNTNKIYMLIHDCGEDNPTELVAADMAELLKDRVTNMLEWLDKIHN